MIIDKTRNGGEHRDVLKQISLKEFQDLGYLQEANRLFFHPLGLCLEVLIDHRTKELSLSGICDYRDEVGGVAFKSLDDEVSSQKAISVQREREKRRAAREKLLGGVVQSIGSNIELSDIF